MSKTSRAIRTVATRAIAHRAFRRADCEWDYEAYGIKILSRMYGEDSPQVERCWERNNALADIFYSAKKALATIPNLLTTRKGLHSRVNLMRKYCDYQV